MTLREIGGEYRETSQALRERVRLVEELIERCGDPEQGGALVARAQALTALYRETRDMAVVCERYYDRGYHRNGKYTL